MDDRGRRFVLGGVLALGCLAYLLLFIARPSDAEGSRTLEDPPEATPAPAPTAGTSPSSDPAPDWANMTLDAELDGRAQPAAAPETDTTPEAPPAAPQGQETEETGQTPAPTEGTAPPIPAAATYTVKRGDTLYDIAQDFGIALNDLIAANPLPNPHRLEVGQVISIPAGMVAAPAAGEAAPAEAEMDVPNQASEGIYTVQRGDTLFEIAQRFGTTMDTLVALNQLSDPNRIEAGQVLRLSGEAAPLAQPTPAPSTPAPPPSPQTPSAIPPATGELYVVQGGDTLNKIARRFGITVTALIAANNLADPNRIMPGQQLHIGGETAESTPPPATPTPAPTEDVSGGSDKRSPAGSPLFIWPIPREEGWLVKGFQVGHRAIDEILPIGTPILASAGGVVEFSGWNAGGYGNLVVIDHGNGYRTLYAHQSERQVASGDQVAQGQVIGLVGSTGWSTHPHLHFEVIIDNQRVNPCLYLPAGCE